MHAHTTLLCTTRYHATRSPVSASVCIPLIVYVPSPSHHDHRRTRQDIVAAELCAAGAVLNAHDRKSMDTELLVAATDGDVEEVGRLLIVRALRCACLCGWGWRCRCLCLCRWCLCICVRACVRACVCTCVCAYLSACLPACLFRLAL